jgi:hypothetical protein
MMDQSLHDIAIALLGRSERRTDSSDAPDEVGSLIWINDGLVVAHSFVDARSGPVVDVVDPILPRWCLRFTGELARRLRACGI